MLGTNDTKNINWKKKADFISDYSKLIQSYKKLSSTQKIYIALVPPVFRTIQGISQERISKELIPMLYKIASLNNVNVIDTHQIFLQKKELFPDGIHPNEDGAKMLAQTIAKYIK